MNPATPRFYPHSVTRKNLVSERDERGRLSVDVILEGGSLVIRGQDIGKSVEDFWGSDEYEWAWTISHADYPALRTLLGIEPHEELLDAIVSRFSGDNYSRLSTLLRTASFPINFWSYV